MIKYITLYFSGLDENTKEIAKSAILAIVLKVLGSLLAFIFMITVARLLGTEGAGIYSVALAIASLFSILGRFGLDNVLLRFISVYSNRNDWGTVKRYYLLSMKTTVWITALISIFLYFSSPFIANSLFEKPKLEAPLRWISFAILPFSLLNLHAECLKAIKKVSQAMLVQSIAIPLLSLILIYPLILLADVTGIVITYTISVIASVILSVIFWHRAVSTKTALKSHVSFKELFEKCKPLFLTSIINRGVVPWAPFFFLGYWVNLNDVGIYGAASRIAILISFFLVVVNNVIAPKFAELYDQNRLKELEIVARRSSLLLTLITSPIFIILLFGGPWVMSLFGKDFSEGGLILTILISGQLVSVLCGSVGYLLNMSGHERIVAKLAVISATILVLSSILLIPSFGINGAAIATTSSTIFFNIAALITVKRRMMIRASWVFLKK